MYIEEIFRPWKRKFPEEFYKEFYRLKGWGYTGSSQLPHPVAKITNQLICDFLPDNVIKEVRKRKSKNEKIHQWLSSDVALDHLDKQIIATITLMRASDTWEEFEKLFKRSFKFNIEEQSSFIIHDSY